MIYGRVRKFGELCIYTIPNVLVKWRRSWRSKQWNL